MRRRKQEPTPMNDRYNTMPKYRGFKPGVRRAADEPEHHGTVKVIYSRDFPEIDQTYYCSQCRWPFREPKHGFCPRCMEPFSPPK